MAESSFTEQINYRRRKTLEVSLGHLPLGGENPIRVQTMADVSTTDIAKAIAQAISVADAGADYFRFTAQGVKQAEALNDIQKGLKKMGYSLPLIADIHFNPAAAFEALKYVEKVRINPGNFAELRLPEEDFNKTFLEEVSSHLEEKFGLFIEKAKSLGRTIRIGTNHGSLSQRMLRQWGNTPRGMVESALEYLLMCRRHHFFQVVISMKSSNVLVMTEAVRLLVKRLEEESLPIPLHLGVTEAGESEDGRVKSAVGIGSLLADGIGDTLRVSLSEPPEAEIPVAKGILEHIRKRATAPKIDLYTTLPYHRNMLPRDKSIVVPGLIGKNSPAPVWIRGSSNKNEVQIEAETDLLLSSEVSIVEGVAQKFYDTLPPFAIDASHIDSKIVEEIKKNPARILLLYAPSPNRIGHWRNAVSLFAREQLLNPIILGLQSDEKDFETLLLEASIDLGTLLLDGVGSGLCLEAPSFTKEQLYRLGLNILQATRVRFSHAEFISCPGCGRTLYNLQGAVAEIKKYFGHLKNLKIGVMGCIVNGPGEMADADYGYVGGAPGKIDLYKGQQLLKRGIPQSEAVDSLIQLLKENGDWVDP